MFKGHPNGDMVLHLQKGPIVLSYIYRSLKKIEQHWFWALRSYEMECPFCIMIKIDYRVSKVLLSRNQRSSDDRGATILNDVDFNETRWNHKLNLMQNLAEEYLWKEQTCRFQAESKIDRASSWGES